MKDTPRQKKYGTSSPIKPFMGLLFLLAFHQVEAQHFTVEGTRILDPQGSEFIVRGTNVTGKGSLWSNTTISDRELITGCWNFNTIRIYYKLYTTGGMSAEAFYAVIDTFSKDSIVVIVDVHDRLGNYFTGDDLDDLVAFWKDMSMRYRDNPYVWFDIHNEPGSSTYDADKWITQYRECIRTIRDTVGAMNLILVEGTSYGQDAPDRGSGDVPPVQSAILTLGDSVKYFGGKEYPNIVMSFHVYDQFQYGGESRIRNFVRAMWDRGHAVIIGEWGNYNNKDISIVMRNMAGILDDTPVGRIVWHWQGGDGNKLTTSGGGRYIIDCENPRNLTELGRYVFEDNHRHPYDTIAPSPVTRLRSTRILSMSAELAWSPARDDREVRGYLVHLDGDSLMFTVDTTCVLTGLVPSTAYVVGVVAVDGTGNRSGEVMLEVTTLAADTLPPSTSCCLRLIERKTEVISLSWGHSADDQGIRGYHIIRDGATEAFTDDTFLTMYGLNPGSVYRFQVEAEDLSGNRSLPTPVLEVTTLEEDDFLVLDDRETGPGMFQFDYRGWRSLSTAAGRFNTSEHNSKDPADTLVLRFRGSYIAYYGTVNVNYGKARFFLDDRLPVEVDFYAPSLGYQELVWRSDTLHDGDHVLKVTPAENLLVTADFVEIFCENCFPGAASVPRERGTFSIFPNPADEMLGISMDGYQPEYVRVYSLTGSLVLTARPPFENPVVLDLSGIEPGMYWMILGLPSGAVETGKFVKIQCR